MEKLRAKQVRITKLAYRACKARDNFLSSLSVAAGEYSVLNKKQKKVASNLLNKLPVKTKTLRKYLSKDLVIVLRRIPKEKIVFLREGSSLKKIETWYYNTAKPWFGWPKFRRPFPTTRREKNLLNRLGNFPKTFTNVSWERYLVCPERSSLYYSETQFWIWYEWLSLNSLMTAVYLAPNHLVTKMIRRLLYIVPRSLDSMDETKPPWFRKTRAGIFGLLRVSRRNQKI